MNISKQILGLNLVLIGGHPSFDSNYKGILNPFIDNLGNTLSEGYKGIIDYLGESGGPHPSLESNYPGVVNQWIGNTFGYPSYTESSYSGVPNNVVDYSNTIYNPSITPVNYQTNYSVPVMPVIPEPVMPITNTYPSNPWLNNTPTTPWLYNTPISNPGNTIPSNISPVIEKATSNSWFDNLMNSLYEHTIGAVLNWLNEKLIALGEWLVTYSLQVIQVAFVCYLCYTGLRIMFFNNSEADKEGNMTRLFSSISIYIIVRLIWKVAFDM